MRVSSGLRGSGGGFAAVCLAAVKMSEKGVLLLVEDDAVVAVAISKQLNDAGYTVLHADSGMRALKLIENGEYGFDLALLDIDLGTGIDGAEVGRRITADHEIAVVFLSAYDEPEYVGRTEQVESYGYILKDSGKWVLLRSVETALRLSREKRQLKALNAELRRREGHYHRLSNQLIERVRELNCLYSVSRLCGDESLPLETALQRVVETLPTGMQHPDRTAAQLIYGSRRFVSTTPWPDECAAEGADKEDSASGGEGVFSCEILAGEERVGRLELCNLNAESNPQEDGFLSEERDLVRSVAGQLGRLIHARNAEAEIRKRERYVTTALDSIGDAVITTDIDGRVTRMNPVAARLTGWDQAEAYGRHIRGVLKLVDTQTREPVPNPVERVLTEGIVVGLANDTGLISRDGTERQIADSAAPIKLEDGEALGVVMVFRDVTEEYRQRRALAEREAQFRSLFENNHAVMLLIDPADGAIVEANPAACNYYGWSRNELLQMRISEINTLTPEEVKAEMERARTKLRSYFEFRHRRADGSVRDVQVYSGPVAYQERELLYSLIFDITEQKEAQKRVVDLLEEKALLLRELQHRVKNNISAVIGLLALQAESTANAEAAASLHDAGRRLQSMTLLYDTLYQAGDVHEVSLTEYLPRLAHEIVNAFPHGEDLELAIDIDEVALKPDTVSPLGIILNELVTNAMKYAYTDVSNGRLEITGRLRGDCLELSVADNGAGFPDSMQIDTAAGFGLQLLKQLTDQLKGTVTIDRGNGGKVVLRFPRSEL